MERQNVVEGVWDAQDGVQDVSGARKEALEVTGGDRERKDGRRSRLICGGFCFGCFLTF